MDKTIAIRVDEDLHRKLTQIAKRESRSVSAQVRYMLLNVIDEYLLTERERNEGKTE